MNLNSQQVYNIYCLSEYGDVGYYITDYKSRFTHNISFLSLLELMEHINNNNDNDISFGVPHTDNVTVSEYIQNRVDVYLVEHIEKDKTIDELLHKYVYYII